MSFACEYLIYSVSKSGFLKRLKFFMVLLAVTIFFYWENDTRNTFKSWYLHCDLSIKLNHIAQNQNLQRIMRMLAFKH